MERGFEGRGAIVAGGSIGIGRAIAVELVWQGVDVAVNYRRHGAEANGDVAETVVGRIVTPEDVAHLVARLCSDRSRHNTGEVIKLDEGQYIRGVCS